MKKALVLCVALALLAGCAREPAAAPQPQSAAESSAVSAEPSESAEPAAPDLSDYPALTERYVGRLLASGAAGRTWSTPFNIGADALVDYYALHCMEDLGEQAPAEFPAGEVEEYIGRYFDVDPASCMRIHVRYDEAANAYRFEGLGATCTAQVNKASLEDGLLTLDYDVYSPREDGTVIWSGTVKIRLSPDGGWKYEENEMRYPLYPVGGDGQTREQLAETYVYPMIPSGRLLQYDWSSPGEMEADHLFFYLCFNNLLGMEKDFEGCFAPGATAPAAEVEAAIREYFDVPVEYLRTSQFYRADGDCYEMIGGFGGGGWQSVLDYAEQDGVIELAVGSYGPDDQPDHPMHVGRLTVEKKPGGGFLYRSYEIVHSWPPEPIAFFAE